MATKTYPFNMEKHAHDIEFRRNRAKNELGDKFLNGTLTEDEESKYDALIDSLGEILGYAVGGVRIAWLPGKLWALAKETVAWAECARH